MYPNLNSRDEGVIKQFTKMYQVVREKNSKIEGHHIPDMIMFRPNDIHHPEVILDYIVSMRSTDLQLYKEILSKMDRTDAKILDNNVIIKDISEPDRFTFRSISNNDPQMMNVLSNVKSMRPDVYSGLMEKYNKYNYYKTHKNPDNIDIDKLLRDDGIPRRNLPYISKRGELIEPARKKKTTTKPKRKPVKCSCKKK